MFRRLTALVLTVSFFLCTFVDARTAAQRFPKQHAAMHMIVQANDQGADFCTATAIGPHALITAAHCQFSTEDQDDSKVVLFVDPVKGTNYLSPTPYEIKDTEFDHADHMILLVTGPAFKDTVDYDVEDGYQGEQVAWFGNPEGVRDQFRTGEITGYSPTDEEFHQPFWVVQAPSIPGDSGSLVFDVKTKKIIGIVTYGIKGGLMGMFPLQFNQQQITDAVHFEGR